jgi:hypothetical protein
MKGNLPPLPWAQKTGHARRTEFIPFTSLAGPVSTGFENGMNSVLRYIVLSFFPASLNLDGASGRGV